jgi:hypothetical protein
VNQIEENENPEYVTMDELRRRGQVTEHPLPPGHKIVPCYCGNCGAHFENTYDFELHKRGCKSKPKTDQLTPAALDTLPWKPFRKGNGEWIFSNQATLLLEAITSGNTRFGNYHYWTYGDNRFIARKKIGTF